MKRPSKRSEKTVTDDRSRERDKPQLPPGKLSLSQLQVAEPPAAGSRSTPGKGGLAPLGPISRKKTTDNRIADDARARLDEAAGASGRPLPEALRSELEAALGADLTGVRLHTSSRSAAAAEAISARAFASGDNIHFAAGEYAPDSIEGRALIAHEVAHTVQSTGGGTATALSDPADSHERAADSFAAAFSRLGGDARSEVMPAAPAGVIHREEPEGGESEGEEPSHADQLAEIQAMQMSSLLPAIAALPADVKTDYAEAGHVGGPRLQAAMYAVNDGGDWKSYITSHNDVAGHLPADQLDDIMAYLGGPNGQFKFFKGEGGETSNFDGSADPGGYITLYWRVHFLVKPGTNLSNLSLPPKGAPDNGWWTKTLEARDKFGTDFKSVVEAAWSDKATIKCKSDEVPSFKTRVEISIVETGFHAEIELVPGTRSAMHGLGAKTGTWSVGDNVERPSTDGVNRQTTSAHEFGHAIGVPHPDTLDELREEYAAAHATVPKDRQRIQRAEAELRKWNALPDKDSAQYGDTPEEHAHQMGRGNQVRAIGGPDAFNPFTPFMGIAKKWGDEFVVAPAINEWSSE